MIIGYSLLGLLVSFLIWWWVSYLPSYETLMLATLPISLVGIISIFIFIVSVIILIKKLLLREKIGTKLKKFILISFFIPILLIFSKTVVNCFSPDYVGKINKEINSEVISVNIPPEDIVEIKKIASTLSNNKGLGISYYNCQKNTPTPSNKISIEIGPKPSNNCLGGDVLLEIRGGYYSGPLGSVTHHEYYLLRKIENIWTIIEKLENVDWIS